MTPQFILIYCSENQGLANKFSAELATSGVSFMHVKADENTNLTEVLSSSSPAILLVTDNFLKNERCMIQAYANYGQMIKSGRLLVIVAEGQVINTDGSTTKIPTHFEKVANVIQYMNYWQDHYLFLRKQHNLGMVTEAQVNAIKTISTEVGDFIRLLRDANFQYYENITARNYQQFCQMAGLPMPTFVTEANAALTQNTTPVYTPPQPLSGVSTVTIGVPKPIISIETPQAETEDELIESIIDQIPGIGLLPNINYSNGIENMAVKEIDEDDFFNENVTKLSTSNIDEVMEEVISEEENDTKEPPANEEETDIETIFDEEEVDDIFHTITNGKAESNQEFTADIVVDEMPMASKELENQEVIEVERDSDEQEDENILIAEIAETIVPEAIVEPPVVEELTAEIVEVPAEIQAIIKAEIAEKNELTQALATIQVIENSDPKAKLAAALEFAKQQDFRAATAQLEDILAESPNNSDAYFLLAEISELNHDFIMARAYYEKTAHISPYYPAVYEKLARLSALHFPTETKQIKKYFKRAIDLEENNNNLLYAYADFLNLNGENAEKAIKYFKRVLKNDENHPFAHYDLAMIFYKAGEHSLASEHYNLACENNSELATPENDNAFLNYKILDVERAGEAINLHSAEEEELQPIDNQVIDNNITVSESAPIIASAIEAEIVKIAEETPKEVVKINKYKPNPTSKIVLITGATAGIGRATAELFAKNGYNIILTGRREARLVEIQNAFHEAYEGGCIILDFDVRNLANIKTTFENLNKDWKNIDILVNNAGLALGMDPIHEGNFEHWDAMIDTNIKGLLYMTRIIAPQMVERRAGHIINLCSTAGKEAYPNGNVYCATKFAVEALTRNMRIDLHKFGIRVGQVSPGAVEETEFSAVRFAGDQERAAKIYEGFTPLRAADVADIIYYIANAPAHVNIQDVLVMGTQQASATIIDRSGRTVV